MNIFIYPILLPFVKISSWFMSDCSKYFALNTFNGSYIGSFKKCRQDRLLIVKLNYWCSIVLLCHFFQFQLTLFFWHMNGFKEITYHYLPITFYLPTYLLPTIAKRSFIFDKVYRAVSTALLMERLNSAGAVQHLFHVSIQRWLLKHNLNYHTWLSNRSNFNSTL